MGIIAKPYTFSAGTIISAAEVNAVMDTLYTEFNGNIDNANIKAGANIDAAKLGPNTITSGKLANNSVENAAISYGSVTLLKTGTSAGVKLARGGRAFTLVAGSISVVITFSIHSDDGDPQFSATPRMVGTILMTTGTNVYRSKLTALSNLSATFHINSDSGADIQSGTFLWLAIGT